MESWVKYPRTLHLPSSPGLQSDDKVAHDLSAFAGKEVVITEKMDGENTSLYRDGFHARSLDSKFHPSRSWLAGFHAEVAHSIPEGWRVCGENMYAKHSVCYENLASYFLAFSVWNDANECLSFDDAGAFLAERQIASAPLLARGIFSDQLIANATAALNTSKQEGFVVRLAEAFSFNDFSRSVVKWVRAGHVQTDQHWSKQPMQANQLAKECNAQ